MILQALNSLRPGAEWSLDGNEYEGLVWHDTVQTKPTKSEVQAEVIRLQNDYTNKEYQRNRATEYPAISDQLDMLWHMMDDETIPGKNSPWYDAIKEVKYNNPK